MAVTTTTVKGECLRYGWVQGNCDDLGVTASSCVMLSLARPILYRVGNHKITAQPSVSDRDNLIVQWLSSF